MASNLRLLESIFGRFRIGQGRIIRSRGAYRFGQCLGRGGLGEVWLAEKIGAAGFSKLVAVKTIARDRLEDLRCLEMFMDEARLVANLVHPNIVQVYQLAKSRREVFIIMEHVFGRTVADLLDRLRQQSRALPPAMGAHIASRVCHGLYYAHNKHSRTGRHLRIVHRDVCPSNILVSFRGIPKLSDFGVAKAITSKVDDEGNIAWGKYPYMAPEALERKGTDPRSDIYSLGLVMYEMFTGLIAHDVDSTHALSHTLDAEGPDDRDVRRHVADFPDELASIIVRATEPDPADRYQTAKAFASDLDHWLLTQSNFPDEELLADFLATAFTQAEKHRWW